MPRKNKIIIRTGSAAPTASDFVAGEPAWDSTNSKLYIRNAAGVMSEIGAGGGSTSVLAYSSTSSFPATGAAATIYIDTSSNRLYRWTGSEYAECGPLQQDSRVDLFLPPAPTGVTATAGNAQATVSWTAPSVLSQTPITDYLVQFSSNGGSTWTTFADGTSASTSATVTGLQNGTSYVFRVAAVNGIGTGAYSSASAAVTPAAGDAYWSSVALLLNMEGSGATFTDLSSYARAVTAYGSATQSTAQAKYGSKSLLLGAGDYLSTAGSQFAAGTAGDFTAEAWVYSTGGSGSYRHVFDTRTSDATGFSLGFDDSNRVFLFSNNAFRVQAGSVALNQWYHLAVCRASGVTRVFLNGTQVGSDWSNTVDYSQTTVLIGKYYASGLYPWLGHIDEVRWTAGTARYTTAFTPSTTAFPTS